MGQNVGDGWVPANGPGHSASSSKVARASWQVEVVLSGYS